MQNLGKTEKKRGRPATGRDPSVTIRVPSPLLAWIDEQAKQCETGRSDMVLRLIEESSLGVPQRLRTIRIAYHEAGHAVVARAIGLPIERATIESDETSLGHVMPSKGVPEIAELWTRRKGHTLLDNEAWYADVMVSMAGREAEMMVLGFLRPDGGDRDDRRLIRKSGRVLAWDLPDFEKTLRSCTMHTVMHLKRSIRGVAEALLGSETLGQKRVDQIIAKSGELAEARRFIAWRWREDGLTPKRRRKPGAPKRRASDHS